MRVLLINSNRFHQPWPVIPAGLCSVATSVEEAGHNVRLLDLCFATNCRRELKTTIESFQPDVIGISIRNIDNAVGCNTLFLLEQVKRDVVEPCKKLFKGTIVLGGTAVGINGPEILHYLDLEYAICGDGELAMVEFLTRLETRASLEGLGGLVIRQCGHIIQHEPPLRVPNLDTLAFPNFERYIDLSTYAKFNSPLQIQTKRGCAFGCVYCTYNKIEGKRIRLRSPSRIADEIEALYRSTGVRSFEFTDSVFNAPLEHCKQVLREIQKRDLPLQFRTMGLNPRFVDDELVTLMKQLRFTDVDFGVESACDHTLEGLGKNYGKKDVIRAAEILRHHHIPTTWYLLVGAPNETQDSLDETCRTVLKAASRWDLINVGIGLRIYNGSPLSEQLNEQHSAPSADNYLRPVHLEPDEMTLNEVKVHIKRLSFRHPNLYMYDEDETLPLFVLRLGYFFLRLVAPKQPLWRLHIIIRHLQTFLGIRTLARMFFERRLQKGQTLSNPLNQSLRRLQPHTVAEKQPAPQDISEEKAA